jgi:hypothetical protein
MTETFKSRILENPAFVKFNTFVGAYKFGDPVGLIFSAGDSFVNCEILHRKAERAKIMGLPKSEYYESVAMLHNAQGLKRLERAQECIKKAVEMYPRIIEKEDELVSDDEMKKILVDHDVMIKDEIFEMDIAPEEANEIWNEYTKARKVVDAKKMHGLIEHVSSKIDELKNARKDLKKGRAHTSPLPYWKIAILAAVLCVAIGAIIYCYKKEDCKWVWELVKSVGGWLLDLVMYGC